MIYFFSGSGNSKHIANIIARENEDTLIDLNLYFKENCEFKKGRKFISSTAALKLPSDTSSPLVFVYPTYAWRQPRILSSYLKSRKEDFRQRRLYFVATAGDSFGGSASYLVRLCRSLSAVYMGFDGIIMPENYTARYPVPDEEEAEDIINSGNIKAKAIAARIREGERLEADPALCRRPFILSTVVNPIFYYTQVSASSFFADNRCDSCRLCEKLCPLNCISMKENAEGKLRPEWRDNCTHCMACINHCPQEAIEYGNESVGKRRYYI